MPNNVTFFYNSLKLEVNTDGIHKEDSFVIGKESGCLSKWKKHYCNNVKRVKICGESGDVRGDTVTSWKERLPEILRGYDKPDIFNLDETSCLWRARPDRGFSQKGKQGKKKNKIDAESL